MRIAPGTKLGPYEIVDALGSGGMGEVYRARDTRLGREVAVKVLPASFAADSERVRRFEQEAQAAGKVNHPNILAIYDVGTHDGSPYVVSELLEGRTLREELSDGALPVRRATDYAAQTAQGLAAAHTKGIVHRDLKPENLFVTPDGRVKILDFGLAKLTERQPPGTAESTSPTVVADTQPGMVLGTVGYMSPEQVRGLPADHRADIFGLGAVLYEMVAGTRAFGGESAGETMNAILTQEPPEVGASRSDLPPVLDGVIRRCLEKQPEQRFQSASDLAFALTSISTLSTSSAQLGAEPLAEGVSRNTWRLAVGVVALLAVVAATVVMMQLVERPTPQPTFQRLTYRRGTIHSARFAPDGQTIFYTGEWGAAPMEILSTRADSAGARSLAMTTTELLSISTTGEMAVANTRRLAGPFPRNIGVLARASLAGGAPRDIARDVFDADWAPHGESIAVIRPGTTGRNQIEFPVGTPLYQTDDEWLSDIRVSPTGDYIAFIEHPPTEDSGEIVLMDLAGDRTVLSTGWVTAGGLAWTPAGDEIWFTATRAGAARDLHAVSLTGEERRLLTMPATLVLHDLAAQGQALLSVEEWGAGMLGLAPGDTTERDLTWLDYSTPTYLSEDGRTLLFTESGGGGADYAAYIRDTDGSEAIRLGPGIAMSLSPDRQWALTIPREVPGQIVLLPTSAGETRTLSLPTLEVVFAAIWFQDGGQLLLAGYDGESAPRMFMLDLDSEELTPVTPPGVGGQAALAPDGTTIVVVGQTGPPYLFDLENGEQRSLPGATESDFPVRWALDGDHVFIVSADSPDTVERINLETGAREVWKELTPTDPAGVSFGGLLLSGDGESYVRGYIRRLSKLYLVTGIE